MRMPVGDLEVVDLSVLVDESLPTTWPGHMSFAHKNWTWYSEVEHPVGRVRSAGPYSTNFIVMDEHCGTHVDGPTHFIPPPDSGLPHAGPHGLVSGDQLDLSRLFGPCLVVDVRNLPDGQPGRSPFIEPEHLQEWERRFGAIRPGEVVLFRSDWDRWYLSGDASSRYLLDPLVRGTEPGWPAPSPQAMEYLHSRGCSLVGTDAPSMGAVHDGAPVHQVGLSAGMLFVEMLTRLGRLPERGAHFLFLPVKIAGSTGGPGRAVALIASDPASNG